MKLYFLEPNNYCEHWTTCANSPEEALEQIKSHLKNDISTWMYETFKNASVDNLPENYELKEFPLTSVIEGEYS
jgi:hypothetical protein